MRPFSRIHDLLSAVKCSFVQFWKQFFEASANISLSSYEEPPEGEDVTAGYDDADATQAMDENTPRKGDHDAPTPGRARQDDLDDSSLLDSLSIHAAHTTPRRTGEEEPSFAEYPSPYETLKQEMTQNPTTKPRTKPAGKAAPTTPGQTGPTFLPPASTPTAQSSPFLPYSAARPTSTRRPTNPDPLLHRVLDKNYRIQATPHTTQRDLRPHHTTDATQPTPVARHDALLDSSPFSPQLAAPQLRSEIFGTPAPSRRDALTAPRTPGISVHHTAAALPSRSGAAQTPGADEDSTRRTLFSQPSTSRAGAGQRPRAAQPQRTPAHQTYTTAYDSDLDIDDIDVSPPKTLQFHVPATVQRAALMQTPARDASRKIVEDLMRDAGVGDVTSTLEDMHVGGADEEGREFWEDDLDEDVEDRGRTGEDDSPSVVRVGRNEDDDAF